MTNTTMNTMCVECSGEIIKERAELGYCTCLKCASGKPSVRGVMMFDEYLTPTLHVVSGEKFASIKHFYDVNVDNIPEVEE